MFVARLSPQKGPLCRVAGRWMLLVDAQSSPPWELRCYSNGTQLPRLGLLVGRAVPGGAPP